MTQFNRVAHVMLAVHDVEASTKFYNQVLGMEIVNTLETDGMKVTFLSFGTNDHDLAVMQVPKDQAIGSPGLAHTALEIKGGLDELSKLYQTIKMSGMKVEMTADHVITKSFYLQDPDGNRLEIFTQAMSTKAGKEVIRNAKSLDELLRPLELGVQ